MASMEARLKYVILLPQAPGMLGSQVCITHIRRYLNDQLVWSAKVSEVTQARKGCG